MTFNKHNFPKGYILTTTEPHTEQDATELMHLAIDCGIGYDAEMSTERISEGYPFLTVKDNTLMLSAIKSNNTEAKRIFVTLDVFKALMKGQTTVPVPYEESLKLNEKYTAVVTKKGITVGCQFFPHNLMEQLHKLTTEAQNSPS